MDSEFRKNKGRKKTRNDDDKCLVCGEHAKGTNFGVPTCSPCKAFFRRNAVKLGTTEFECQGDGNCPVTSNTRRQCNCCRLAKCFYVGMNPKAIRTDDERQQRRELVEFNRQKRAEAGKALIRPSELLLNSQACSLYLSSNDSTLITNIFHAYESTCMSYTYKEHLSMPVNETLTLQKFLNASSNMYIGFINYIKSIPEFNSIPVDAKMSLIKNNLKQTLRKHGAYIMQHVTPDLTGIALGPFVNDPILIPLFIIILMLSTHMNIEHEDHQFENDNGNIARQILAAQNVYVELLWRYIVSRCSNYQQSVQLLSSLITRTLYSQIIQVKINTFIRTNILEQNEQLEPIIKSLWTS